MADVLVEKIAPSPIRKYKKALTNLCNLWVVAAITIIICVSLPLMCILSLSFLATENIWGHMIETVLSRYVTTTLILMIGVAFIVLLIGVSSAWLTSMCDFPGKTIFEWALLLPFAIPAYVIAYTYTDLLEFAGPVQQGLRWIFAWQTVEDYWFPEIRSLGGAIVMLSLVLYPYIYLFARAAFLEQSVCVLEAARVLGHSPWCSFISVALPLARPAIASGMALALMETLNDIGTVDYFAVQTLTLGIYNSWLIMDNLGGAAQIALIMLVFVCCLIFIERYGRFKQTHFQMSTRIQKLTCYKLTGYWRWGASFFCFTLTLFGFIIPFMVLAYYVLMTLSISFTAEYLLYAWNSLLLAFGTACIVTVIGLVLAYGGRLSHLKWFANFSQIARLGYAMPGAFLSLGILIPLAALDNTIDQYMDTWFGISTGLLFSGSLFILFYAYCVRFLGISFGAIENSLSKITPHMDDAARNLGQSSLGVLRHIHFPMIRGGILTGALIVFVDTMKELPATLLLRPFNFDTLAIFVYQFASDELLEECALGAITIVIIGLIPVVILSQTISNSRPVHH